jgi:hypothetical protein
MEFMLNGVALSRADFGDSFEDWVAFTIAFCGATHCRDKAAQLELLRFNAASIIAKVAAKIAEAAAAGG